jgi:hypothetical protein
LSSCFLIQRKELEFINVINTETNLLLHKATIRSLEYSEAADIKRLQQV